MGTILPMSHNTVQQIQQMDELPRCLLGVYILASGYISGVAQHGRIGSAPSCCIHDGCCDVTNIILITGVGHQNDAHHTTLQPDTSDSSLL